MFLTYNILWCFKRHILKLNKMLSRKRNANHIEKCFANRNYKSARCFFWHYNGKSGVYWGCVHVASELICQYNEIDFDIKFLIYMRYGIFIQENCHVSVYISTILLISVNIFLIGKYKYFSSITILIIIYIGSLKNEKLYYTLCKLCIGQSGLQTHKITRNLNISNILYT